jgi:hypothetical protein
MHRYLLSELQSWLSRARYVSETTELLRLHPGQLSNVVFTSLLPEKTQWFGTFGEGETTLSDPVGREAT